MGAFYRWKKEYAGLEPDQAREFKQLADDLADEVGDRQPPLGLLHHCHYLLN